MARHYSTSPDYPQEPEDKMYSSTILARIFTLVQLLKNAFYRPQVWCLGLLAIYIVLAGFASISSASDAETWNADQAAKRMVQYFDRISQPKPFTVRTGEELKKHNEMIRQRILKDLNLDPLPKRIDLDPHYSDTKEHPWCTIRRVAIQLWPGVYSRCLLYMPREFPEKPAPAALCPHGHEGDGYADADLQKRFLMLAKLGYVVLSTPQDHHEDILRGYSYQTYLTWNNMRAMDFLETLPEVDKNRIGVSGLSGGGLQSEMIVGLDPRIKAATIAGLACDYREIIFPFSHHCFCNHWPNVMTYTDQPEISTLSCPTPVQYLSMNDWTKHFAADNFPTIQTLYRENGAPDKVEVVYWPTHHVYDRPKRERTYWWMEKWVRGKANASIILEPDNIEIISPASALLQWEVKVPKERSFEEYTREATRPVIQLGSDAESWKAYRAQMGAALRDMLGESQILSASEKATAKEIHPAWADDLKVEEVFVPSEDHILIPAIIIHPPKDRKLIGVEICLSAGGRSVAEKDSQPYIERARKGALVVLPDLRFSGDYSVERLAGHVRRGMSQFRQASSVSMGANREEQQRNLADSWDRNGILWGRPIPGLMVADLRSLLDFLESERGVKGSATQITALDSAPLALAGLLAACTDPRIQTIDVDFKGRGFANAGLWSNDRAGLPNISKILRYGDIPQWTALLADRRVTLRNAVLSDANRRWLENVFATYGTAKNLRLQ
jgi:hypothetical protein